MLGLGGLHALEPGERRVLQQPLRIEKGEAVVPTLPGTGLAWDEEAVARFAAE